MFSLMLLDRLLQDTYMLFNHQIIGVSKDCSNYLFKALFQVRKCCALVEYVGR